MKTGNLTQGRMFSVLWPEGFHTSPGSKPPMSSWVFALNSFVLPIQEVKRQSCSLAGSLPLWKNSTWLSRLSVLWVCI